ncbi:MAG: M14 family zinc carboxypeptidase [Clostridia bacterium]|nr:M14 family zinc carboxypeptidase [Clostridia bacterium]
MFLYENLLEEIEEFNKRGFETGYIGESVLEQKIPYVFLGEKGKPSIIVVGALHAREYITALLVLYQAKRIIKQNFKLNGGIYFVPMLNVDGVRLATEGIGWIKNKTVVKKLIEVNKGTYFGLFKANANCVDLNVNFDAGWGKGKQNVFFMQPMNYVGKAPMDQPETSALASFTQQIDPILTMSYHTKGEVIYWNYHQTGKRLWCDYSIAKVLARQTGYSLKLNEGSSGGYKDWCIQRLSIPSFTIEVGKDTLTHPIGFSEFKSIYDINKDSPRLMLNLITRKKHPIT